MSKGRQIVLGAAGVTLGLTVMLLFAGASGCETCQKKVPAGHIDIEKTANGFKWKVLGPGHHFIWGRSELVLLEMREDILDYKGLEIQCADKQDVTLDLSIRSQGKLKPTEAELKTLMKAFGAKLTKSKGGVSTLKYNTIVNVYLRRQAEEITRSVVSKYKSMSMNSMDPAAKKLMKKGKKDAKGKAPEVVQPQTQKRKVFLVNGKPVKSPGVRENRMTIKKAIFDRLTARLEGIPIVLKEVMVTNIDPPKLMKKAIQRARQREVEIEEERATQAKRMLEKTNEQAMKMMEERNTQARKMLEMKNKVKLAVQRKLVMTHKVDTEAIRVRIIGPLLAKHPRFLDLLTRENNKLLYKHTRSATIVTNGNAVSPLVGRLR